MGKTTFTISLLCAKSDFNQNANAFVIVQNSRIELKPTTLLGSRITDLCFLYPLFLFHLFSRLLLRCRWNWRSEPIRKVTCRILSPLTKKPNEDKDATNAASDNGTSGGGGGTDNKPR